jgi:glutamate racemase
MIGIFDSGLGGLTVVKEIFKRTPEYQIIYFGDTARLPYGTKGADFVKRYSRKIVDFLLKKGAKLIVVACHTSSAWASDFLKKQFLNIPVFETISPALEEVLLKTENKKIAVVGTSGTIKSGSWQRKLLEKDAALKIYPIACPLFVPLIEEGWLNKKITEKVVQEHLKPLKSTGIDVLVLACTHYPLVSKTIKKIVGRRVQIINPAESLAASLERFLKNNLQTAQKIKKGKDHQFFFSDDPYNLKKISRICLGKDIQPIIGDPFSENI